MPSGVRANSLLIVATPSVLVRSLDEAVEYLDRDGVPRRRMAGEDVRRLVLRGSSLSSLDTVRAIYDRQELDDDEENDLRQGEEDEDEGDREEDDANNRGDVYSSSKRLEEKLAVERVRAAKMLRREQMIREIHASKQALLVAQHEEILTRVQLWNDAMALDSLAELTSVHTALSPSSKAHAFVDEDGNVRRKASVEETPTSTDPKAPVTAASVIAGIADAVAASPRKSLVLEFIQIVLAD